MTAIIITTLVLITIIIVQIGRLVELSSAIRGEEESVKESNKLNAYGMIAFMVFLLVGVVWSAIYYTDDLLGYGPNVPASEHGASLDKTFQITLFFTGVVFFITQILLFWFSYKYREQLGRKSLYMPHDNRLEFVWTIVPAVVMTFLVVNGLETWNTVMADVGEEEVAGEDFIELEATGYQWAWILRYPGEDNLLGTRDYKMIDPANNPLGQDWTDTKNLDDFHPNDIVVPVGKKVRVRITARDVLHNFYLPQFRLKMDAVPGMPTYFVFTPKYTTDEYRMRLKDEPEWNTPVDPNDPESPMRWEAFDFELACAELCGKGHYSMRKIVKVVTEAEYEKWLSEQTPYYDQMVKGKEGIDPYLTEAAHDEADHDMDHGTEEHSDSTHSAESH